jgi:hypothetical protein
MEIRNYPAHNPKISFGNFYAQEAQRVAELGLKCRQILADKPAAHVIKTSKGQIVMPNYPMGGIPQKLEPTGELQIGENGCLVSVKLRDRSDFHILSQRIAASMKKISGNINDMRIAVQVIIRYIEERLLNFIVGC